jgi:glucan phosphoethanolaminetransferase (alkaline phosphatase superfamily)
MEYYILKMYQEAKKNCSEVEQGFDRFEPNTKRIVIGCLVAMFISCAEMIITMLIFPQKLWYFIGVIICVSALFVVLRIDSKEQKKHMEKYVDSHKKKLKILYNVLSDEFQINTKEKLNSLISLYQEDVEKKKDEEKKRNGFILTIFSVFAGVLTISFENMGLIGIDFVSWLYLATILLIFVSAAGIWIYSYKYFDSFKRKYELMIKDLKELLLIKY